MLVVKALVTGGAGFIGSHLCETLLNEGYEVICLDNLDPYYTPALKRGNIASLVHNGKFEMVRGDILDQGLVRNIVRDNVDYIFHYAAQAGIRASIQDPMKTHKVNATGTLNVLEACRNSNVKKVINASSSSVYGNVEYLPIDEQHPNLPVSPYGVSKLAAEHYCQTFHRIYGLVVVCLRLFTVYGPRMRPDLAISIFMKRALKNASIEVFGDGKKTRDFTYIDDVIKANILALDETVGSHIFNIGSGNRISIGELTHKIVAITEAKSEVLHSCSQKGDAEHTLANIDRAERELGWKPKVHIDEGLLRYANWWKDNQVARDI